MAEARGRSVSTFLTQNAVISDGNNLASIVLLALILTPIQIFRCLNDILLCSTRLYPKWSKMKAMIRFLQKSILGHIETQIRGIVSVSRHSFSNQSQYWLLLNLFMFLGKFNTSLNNFCRGYTSGTW